MTVQPRLMFNLASASSICHWARTTAEQGLFIPLCWAWQGLWWSSQPSWGSWAEGPCPWAPSWVLGQVCCTVLAVQAAGTPNNHGPQQHPWHALPFLTQQDVLWHFTMVTQGKIQSPAEQEGIFSMVLPIFQHLGFPDIIKLCLVVPSLLSTSRRSFKQLFSWLSHRQQCITNCARNFTSLG